MTAIARSNNSIKRSITNPILWQERTHQERSAPRWTRHGLLFGLALALTLPGMALAMLIATDGYPAMQVALFVVWGMQATTMLRAVVAGANTVSREHVGQTWDALVLTGVSARRIVMGKWRAAMHSVRGWMLILGVVRLAMLPIFSLGIVKVYAWFSARRYTSAYPGDLPEFAWVPWAWVLAVVGSVLLTILEVACCTALGIAASSLTRRGIAAAVLAISIRFAPVIAFAAFLRYQLGPTQFWRWWGRTEFSLSDAGTSALMVLALPEMPWTRGDHVQSLPGLLLAGGLVGAMMLGALALTWVLVRRGGALAQANTNQQVTAFRFNAK